METPRSSQELTAASGDVDSQHQQMQREATLSQSVQPGRISCDIGCDRRNSRGKELRVAVLCISRHSSCRGVIEFRCAEVARPRTSATAAAAAIATASATIAAALATTTSVYVVWVAETRPARQELTALNRDCLAARATSHVVWVAGTPLSIQELTASNGDVDVQHQQMQQTRRHCGRRCSVDRISCDIGRDGAAAAARIFE